MRDCSFTARAADGLSLHVHGFGPEGEPKAALQVIHGMSEHGARYARVAERFTAAGFVVYAVDQRGHGKTAKDGALGRMGGLDAWDRAVSDHHVINQRIREMHPGVPVVVLGHSMGSFMTQQLAFQHPRDADGIILSASNGRPPLTAVAGRVLALVEAARLGGDATSPLLQRVSFEEFNRKFAPTRTSADWLSRDPDEVDEYVADPLCGFACTVNTWQSMLRALGVISDPKNQARIPKDLPIFLAAGDRDPVGDFGSGVRRLRGAYLAAGLTDVTMKLYPGARHEILNETNRDEVEADMLAFAERVVARAKAKAA